MREQEHWALIGENGAGKTTMALALRGEAAILSGALHRADSCASDAVGLVSFEEQCRLFQKQKEDYDNLIFAAGGRHPPAITAVEAIGGRLAAATTSRRTTAIVHALGLQTLLDQPYVSLSSGEHRRLLIAEALAAAPRVLILDEPFDGLDDGVRAEVNTVLEEACQRTSMILITHRAEEIPSYITHAAVLGNGAIQRQGARAEFDRHVLELDHGRTGGITPVDQQPAYPSTFTEHQQGLVDEYRAGDLDVADDAGEEPGDQLLEMCNITVEYSGRRILPAVSWGVQKGENWAVTGPNGSGKSTLVRLAYSDHPQRYSNDIRIMGQGKGKGQSIWQLRSRIGIVTPWLHLQHHDTPFSAFAVVCSGFFDSTGLWQSPSPRQLDVAAKWVELLGLESLVSRPFSGLSQGQQRLVLLARAVVKSPRLLLLDEPTHGLDPENRRRFLDLVDLISERCSVVLVTHHLDEVGACVTHHLQLAQDGSIDYCGPVRMGNMTVDRAGLCGEGGGGTEELKE